MRDVITVVAIVKVKPGHEAEVAQAIMECVAPSRAEAANSQYIPHQDLQNPQTFVFTEKWASPQALAEHMDTPHFKAMAARLEGKLAAPLELHTLRPLPGA